MFRDLKEYQEIQRIYQDNVYDSPDDKLFEEAFKEFNTSEELDYLEENIEYVCEKQNFIKKGLDYINKLRKGLTKVKPKNVKPKDVSKELDNAKKIIQKSDTAIKPNNKVTDIVKSNPKKVDTPKVDTPKVKTDKSGVDKIKDVIKNNPGKTAAIGTGALVTTAALTPGGEEKKEETPKVEEKPKEETPKVEVKKEEPKKEKVKPMSKIEFQNRKRFGDKHVDNLKAKNVDFKKMKKGEMTKKEFIDKYPKSQTAKKYYNSDKAYRDYKKSLKKEDYSYNPIYNHHLANNLAEVYRNMYNTPSEPEVLDEGMGAIKVVKSIPKIKKAIEKKLDSSKPSEGSKPTPESPPDKPSKPSPDLKRPDEPTRPTGPTTPKPRPDTGSKGPKTKRPLPKPTPGPMGTPPKMSKEDFGFDAYDLILEYLLGTEQVETIEEANYVMTEMDDQTIHSIVSEMEDALNEINEGMMGGVVKGASGMAGSAIKGASGMAGDTIKGSMGAARKLMQTLKNLPKGIKRLGQPKPPFKSTKDFDFRPGSGNNPLPPKMKPMTKSGGGMNPATGGYM